MYANGGGSPPESEEGQHPLVAIVILLAYCLAIGILILVAVWVAGWTGHALLDALLAGWDKWGGW